MTCKSCGGTDHQRRSSKLCKNHLPPIRKRGVVVVGALDDDVDDYEREAEIYVVKRGLRSVICPFLDDSIANRLTEEIRSDVRELSRLYIRLGIFVDYYFKTVDRNASLKSFQDMLNFVYALKGKGPYAEAYRIMTKSHDDVESYDGRLRSFLVHEIAKQYWTVLKTNITTHAYSRLVRYLKVKRNDDERLFNAYFKKEFTADEDELNSACRIINVNSAWHSTIPEWLRIQETMAARGDASFVLFPQPGHGLKHVTYTSRGWHELLRRVAPDATASNWAKITDHRSALWAPYLDCTKVDMRKFGCTIQTDGRSVSLSMTRVKRSASSPKKWKRSSTYDRTVAVDPGSRVPIAACDDRYGFRRVTKKWIRSHTLEWKRDRVRNKLLADIEIAERLDRERLEKELDIVLTCKRSSNATQYASFRLKWFEARQKPFETHSKLTRLKFDKFINTVKTNERIVREIFLSDAPSDRVLVLYGAGFKFMNRATFSGRKFRHDDILKRLRARRNIDVEIVNEAYTSKACSACNARDGSYHRLKIDHKLRRGVCPDCNGAPVDRDYNAATNILVNYTRSTLCRPCSAAPSSSSSSAAERSLLDQRAQTRSR